MTFNYSDNLFNSRARYYSLQVPKVVEPQPKVVGKGQKIAAAAVGSAIGLAMPIFDIYDVFSMHKVDVTAGNGIISKLVPNIDTFENTQKNINKLLKEKGLSAKGVEFIAYDGSIESVKKIDSALNMEYAPKTKIYSRLKNNAIVDVINGENAFYSGRSKKIIVNDKHLYTSAYHELGHALNAHSKFGKFLYAGRMLTPFGVSIAAPIVLAIGLFHKTDNTIPKGNKSTKEIELDFVKKHAGALTFASYIPLLAEEALASIKGVNAAKSCLDSSLISKLKKNYLKAWGTYGAVAALVSAGVALGIKAAKWSEELGVGN